MIADRGTPARPTPEAEQPRTRFGETLRAARRDAGLTQAALAVLAGLTQQYVARIEAGQINPTLVTIAAIARALGTDMGDLSGSDKHTVSPARDHIAKTLVWAEYTYY